MQKMGRANSIQPLVESKGQKVQEAQAPVHIFYHCIVYTSTIIIQCSHVFIHTPPFLRFWHSQYPCLKYLSKQSQVQPTIALPTEVPYLRLQSCMSHSSLALRSLARTSLCPESGSSLPGLQSTMPGLCLQQYCLLNKYANFLQGSVEKGDEYFNSLIVISSKVKKVFLLVNEIVQ